MTRDCQINDDDDPGNDSFSSVDVEFSIDDDKDGSCS